jgi:predicted esterase YcpF (UPF0227 family)
MEKKLFIYFSGFHKFKEGPSLKYMLFKDRIEGYNEIIEFNLCIDDLDKNIEEIKKKMKRFDKVHMVSSSLGCIPGMILHFSTGFPITLINPDFFPEKTIASEITEERMHILERYRKQILAIKNKRSLAVFVAADDDTVDYHEFLRVFEENIWRIEFTPTGGHSYTVLPSKIDAIMQPYISGEADYDSKVKPDPEKEKEYRQMNFINIPDIEADDDVLEFNLAPGDKCRIEFLANKRLAVNFTATRYADIESQILPELKKFLK